MHFQRRCRAALLVPCAAISLLCTVPPVHAVGWLATSGNHIVDGNNATWVGHGANIHDTRSCGNFVLVDGTPLQDGANSAGLGEVKRRIDVLVDQWHATFMRLVLESRRSQDTYANNATYRARIKDILDYVGTKPNVYVLASIWLDPTLDANGWPTAATNVTLDKLARDFYTYPYVLYGVSNEPQSNFDGAQDASVWTRMNSAVQAIRDAETAVGGANPNRHVVTVQGTRAWARDLSYYVTHPITAGGGVNVAYETHIYNSPGDYSTLLAPTSTLPVIMGEFGPVNDGFNTASVADMQTLINLAKSKNVPHAAWTFHQYCPPNLIASVAGKTWDANTTNTDGINMPIFPTDFGQLLVDNWKLVATNNGDVDGDGRYDALTDGLILVRYLFGLTGAPLVAGALGPGATITDPAQIKSRLDAIRPSLDIDANGQVDALTDGLMILRYLFGIRGTALMQNALGAGALNTTATGIENKVKSLLP